MMRFLKQYNSKESPQLAEVCRVWRATGKLNQLEDNGLVFTWPRRFSK